MLIRRVANHEKLMKMRLLLFLFILNVSFGAFGLQPDRNYLVHPDSLGLDFEIHQIKSTNNASLHSWVLNPMGEVNLNATIIMAYGDMGNMSYWLNHAAILSQRGFTVVMFDYRGFGKSSDFKVNPNQLYYDEFSEDLFSVYHWTKNTIKNTKIGVWGLSMGTIMTGFLIKNGEPDFLILEGLVVEPKTIKKKIFEAKGKKIILPRSSKKLSKIFKTTLTPMLVFSGKQDKFTTSQDAKKITDLKSNRKSIEFDGNHLEGFNSMTERYFGDQYINEIILFINLNEDW